MAHLTGFGLENFRVFGKETWFDFAPITILTGTNSCGKSSVNKALLLLNESFKKYERFQQLSFATEKHQLNSFENTISNQNKDSDTISFLERYKLFNHKMVFNQGEKISFTSIPISITGDSDVLPFADFIEVRKIYGRKDNQVEIREAQVKLFVSGVYLNLLSFNFHTLSVSVSVFAISFLYNTFINGFIGQFLDFENNYSSMYGSNNAVQKIKGEDFENFIKDMSDKIQEMNVYLTSNNYTVFENKALSQFADKFNLYHTKFDNQYKVNQVLNYYINKYIDERGIIDIYQKTGEEPRLKDLVDNINYVDLSVLLVDYLKQCIEAEEPFYADTVDGVIAKQIDNPELLEELKTKPFCQLLNPGIEEIISNVIKPELECVDNLLKFNTSLTFIEAVRANTQRVYTFQSQGTSVNSLLLGILENGLSDKKIVFLNKWVKEFGIGDAIEINNIKNVANELLLVRGEQKIDIADVGYGFTQLLPMMLKCVHVAHFKDVNWCLVNGYKIDEINPTNSSLIIIEEPETNLHPALQSKVADFIVDFSKHFDATVIIETHSEYLIRRLQFLTAKKEIKPEDTIIHYLFDPNSEHTKNTGEQLRTIRIQQDGRLDKEFGTGFFDESTKLMMSILLGEKLN